MQKEVWPPIGMGCRRRISWKIASDVLVLATMVTVKTALRFAQRVQTKNLDKLMVAIHKRPKDKGLVTISNHASCIDDPVIWGVIPFSTSVIASNRRWTLTAREYMFHRSLFSWFSSRLQAIPISRGLGVYQKGLNCCLEMINEGKWVHIFPEGKINMTLDQLRLKWGVGRVVAEASTAPTVIPIWHVGMDDILPNKSPYYPRFFKKLTILVGEPIDLSSVLTKDNMMGKNAILMRKQLTDLIQQKLYELKLQAESLHQEWAVRSPVAYRTL